jgi:iron complex transport system ATP-binding protein
VLLSAVDVSFGYRESPVLRGVSLEIRRGRIVGILGPNGAGKTTLLRLLSGTLRPSRGVVRLDDVEISSIPRRHLARRLAVVPQETHPTFDYTVLEVALMGRYPYLSGLTFDGPDDVAAARTALAVTGTLDLEHRSFATLSGGEKQRVVIASALAQFSAQAGAKDSVNREAPPILLLDEPTASLDLRYQLEVSHLIRRLNRDRETTMVVSTHDLNLAATVCQELVLLRGGEVVAAGPTSEVLTANHVRDLYGVEADIRLHPEAGHLTVVPLAVEDATRRRGTETV